MPTSVSVGSKAGNDSPGQKFSPHRYYSRRCSYCSTMKTPMWRHGPDGFSDLCNKVMASLRALSRPLPSDSVGLICVLCPSSVGLSGCAGGYSPPRSPPSRSRAFPLQKVYLSLTTKSESLAHECSHTMILNEEKYLIRLHIQPAPAICSSRRMRCRCLPLGSGRSYQA